MFLNVLIVALACICVIRTLSYSIWCFKEKNITGGISVIFLAICASISVIFIL